MDKYAELTAALMAAKAAANEHQNSEDGGTCNFDAPFIDYRAMHMGRAKAEQAIEAAGLSCFTWNSWGGVLLVVCGYGHGQGNRRSRMAEAAAQSLKTSGIVGGMYYQMD